MTVFGSIRSQIGIKLFISYLLVVVVGVVVLVTSSDLAAPRSFDRHLAAMSSMMGGRMESAATANQLEIDLFENFRDAVNEALVISTLAAFGAAVMVSIFVTRQVVAPVRQMMAASQRIAEGDYHERVQVSGNIAKGELDELAQLALSFNMMAATLERTESRRQQLIGDVAHELRTPLATIKGSMEGLIDGVIPPGPESFQKMHREVDRLQRLVSDLQELSRVEAGPELLEYKPILAKNLAETTKERLGRQFQDKGVDLVFAFNAGLPRAFGDEDRIQQVLTNLVGNALQYTAKGGEVRVGATHKDNWIEFSVGDTGIGISAAHLPHIFTRFYRVDPSRSRAGGGSGIGLTIAKYLVEAHGGKLWVESEGKNMGSTFTFRVPATK